MEITATALIVMVLESMPIIAMHVARLSLITMAMARNTVTPAELKPKKEGRSFGKINIVNIAPIFVLIAENLFIIIRVMAKNIVELVARLSKKKVSAYHL